MHMELEYQGKTYKGVSDGSIDMLLETFIDKMYFGINSIDKIKLELEDGSSIIAGSEVVKRSIIRIFP